MISPAAAGSSACSMAFVRCPICDTVFESSESAAMPFCSSRCRRIDLGRWLDEDYGLPIEPEQEPPDEGPTNGHER
jgi:endogenous inhibitor of DNA gyrase (YacG/DUF329 family)